MLKQNRRMQSADYVSKNETMFACPICHSPMEVMESKSLVCFKRHTFDISKQGYINFSTHPVNTKYNKELFDARRKLIIDDGFFVPLSNEISRIVGQCSGKRITILDTGCGEGSHLFKICETVNKDVIGVGIDLSKEGIRAASMNYGNKIWAVADLTNTPFQTSQFDVILNILSPSNYAEFKRVLKKNGIVIKIVPQSGYLKDLRGEIFGDRSYSNEDTVKRFYDNFRIVDRSRLTYNRKLNKSAIEWLVQMTPMTWAKKEKVASILNKETVQITVDFDILIGK
ncbi:putative RNA methyltransferase [Bacillus sp. JJ1562]|uniref:putative RNA methyltransferase n=1 Tax=Bacillus sp. JJ1562 TaxID=3122960 RepID=UPI003001FF65